MNATPVKPERLVWSVFRQGASVIHLTVHQKHPILVTNWPGSRTIWLEVQFPTGECWYSENLDRADNTVAIAKEKALAWLAKALERLNAETARTA